MNKVSKKHSRSWATTIIAGLVAVTAFYLAYASFRPDYGSVVVTATLSLFGILSAIIAVEGRPKTLREIVTSWRHF